MSSGMTNRVSDGSISLDDDDSQSLEVARQVGTGLFMIRIDHLIYDDCTSTLQVNDLVTEFDDGLDVNSAVRDSDQSNSPDCFTHMRWLMFAVVRFWGEMWARELCTVFLVDASSS